MEATTKLNSMQLYMLRMFDRTISPQQAEEIKQLPSDYFAGAIDKEMDEIWKAKGMLQQDLDKALSTHRYI